MEDVTIQKEQLDDIIIRDEGAICKQERLPSIGIIRQAYVRSLEDVCRAA